MGVAILHRVAGEVLTHKVRFEQRPGRNGRRNDVAPWRKNSPGRGYSRYKDCKAGIRLAHSKVSRETGVAGRKEDGSREEKKTEGSWVRPCQDV